VPTVSRLSPAAFTVVGALALVVALAFGPVHRFVDISALAIVTAGTLAAVTLSSSLRDVRFAGEAVIRMFLHPPSPPTAAVETVTRLAEIAWSRGILALQGFETVEGVDPLMASGLAAVIDGCDETEVIESFGRELESRRMEAEQAPAILRRAAEYAPAMGLIGTLIGLVSMLDGLSDTASLGPAMGLALLTTLYGAALANLVLSPLAARLERAAAREAVLGQIYLLGVAAIARQESPRRLRLRLVSLLPPHRRSHPER
jgi:chemotaxis protein MotA